MEMANNIEIPPKLKDYIITTNLELNFNNQIGEGAYGTIVEGKWEGLSVAVKIINQNLCTEQKVNKFYLECDRLCMLRHTNIVQFFGICNFSNSLMPGLVMERLDFNLNDLLNKNIVLSHETKSYLLYQIALGLRYLHNHTPPIIHRDLSSKNIAISKSMVAKIIDFGIARVFFPNKTMTKEFGTLDFMAPEVYAIHKKATEKIDIFSFGCITLHTYTEQWPKVSEYSTTDPVTNQVIGISEIDRRKVYIGMLQNNIGVKEDTLGLIKSCLDNNDTRRPSSIEITDHFKEILPSRLKITLTGPGTCGTALHLNYYEGLDNATLNNIKWWKKMKPNWKKCTDLPEKCWVDSVAELNGKVYMAIQNKEGLSIIPHVYDFKKNRWSKLPVLPAEYCNFSLVTVHNKDCIMAIGGANKHEISNKVYTWNSNRWLNEYPNMPTARCRASSIYYESDHESSVIVAGGITKAKPLTITKAVEVLNLNTNEWYKVESLPHVAYNTIPLIIEDSIYFAVGYDDYIKPNKQDDSTCNIIKASLSDLTKIHDKNLVSSSNAETSTWKKLPDMPYSSWSINHYEGNLIAFTGDSLVQRPEEDKVCCQYVPLIYIYNHKTFLWDYVDDLSGTTINFYLGISIHINENTILFMGGIKGRHENEDDFVTDCYTLTFEP